MKNKFYVTTPLYYVNASPHIGHSYTNIAADTLARFYRNRGYEVYFLTGTDEHGQKIAKVAQEQGLDTLVFADRMVAVFKDLWQKLNISYDDFIRTTEKRHEDTVRWILDFLHKNGDIYQDEYSGWYCVPCESFWTQDQLIEKMCPDCRRSVEHISEFNYFFKLSKYQDWLIDYIKSHPDFIKPQSRYNEVLSFLEGNKLRDLCISRPKERLSWGISIPFSENHVTYVWFDALINYISAVGFSYDDKKFKKFWPADIHLMGKDILRQHAIYWPIILRALGIEPPKMIFAHGWWLTSSKGDKQKMSKSKGNIVNPLDIIKEYGVDTYRYFLLREVPFGLDGTFQEEALKKRFNFDLANDLGNLVYRTLTMAEKYFSGEIPQNIDKSLILANPIMKMMEGLAGRIDKAMLSVDFSSALAEIWLLINAANKYIEETKPWQLSKGKKTKELEEFIFILIEVLKKVACEISPFMPDTASKIEGQIKKDKIKKAPPIFPRIE
ncbi:MAG: methionine--tRNA ligase [Candidatus Omnitrophica bacterium]|nr:methionine--tRNA ligase [Candidatus Omnitrophota bacterium]MDD5351941.1 methionine--tRNA ligase [Candidatus Omnitrophota bacterium]MDD5550767.1 methionine--tRNA ligase [Candidatus Omnitrophota bacterium]